MRFIIAATVSTSVNQAESGSDENKTKTNRTMYTCDIDIKNKSYGVYTRDIDIKDKSNGVYV